MSQPLCFILRRGSAIAAIAAVSLCWAVAYAKAAESSKGQSIGRIDFEDAKLPPANVELDLSQGMFGDLFGIGDAAVAGVAESLMKASKGEGAEATRMAADQLAAARQIVELASKVVREVRVRAYEKAPEEAIGSRFDAQLRDGNWEQVVRLRKGDESVRVSVSRRDQAIRGVFVIAQGHGGMVLVNLVCDMSPENVKQLTAAATRIGLDSGLRQEIEMKFREMHRSMGPPMGPSPKPPQPPRLPQVPKRDAA